MQFSRYIHIALTLCSTLLVTGAAFSAPVSAVDAESMTISPVALPHTVDAGSTVQDKFTVINDGNTEYDFIVYAAPYSVSNYSYNPDYISLKDNTDAFQWVQFDQTSWTLKPGDRIDIPYTLRIPADAAPGGHYGVLFAETQPTEADGTQILRKKRIGTVLQMTVNGDYITAGKTTDTMIDWIQFSPPLTAIARIENTGNVDFKATTIMRAKDVFGNTKYQAASENTVYPKTIRDVKPAWDKAPWLGLYKVELETKVLDKSQISEQFVLIAPKWLLIVLALVLTGGIYGAIVSRKTRK